jgi:acetate---CoA ligase (ADP-forming)
MQKFFYPQSVAVVGVSEDPANLAQGIVYNLLECKYRGKIFLVGRRPGTSFGLPIFPSLSGLPQKVDLAVILAPARVVPDLIKECGELGISRVVVESAGFSELDEGGQTLEDEVRALLQRYNLRMVGPNGLGLLNTENGLALPFAQVRPLPRRGHISIVAQSGGVATHLMAWMHREGLGLNKFLSLGNKLDVDETDALAYLLEDPGTAAIYLYLEGLRDGRALLDIARQAKKPVFLHLANVGPETATIAHSHTASLATDERVLEAACRQSGMIHLKNQSKFLSLAKLVGQPPVPGNRLVILSRSGGEAVVAAYACRQWGFKLPPLSPRLATYIGEHSRAGVIRPNNPIDLGDVFDFSVYEEIMSEVCRDPDVDAILFHYGPMADFELERGRDSARSMLAMAREAGKPLAVAVLCTLAEEEYLRENLGVPVFHFPEEAVMALAASRDQAARPASAPLEPQPALWPKAEKVAGVLAAPRTGEFLALPAALSLIEALGLAVAPWRAVATAPAAVEAADALGYPVVLKLAAASLVHKTDAGAVLLDIQDATAVTAAFARLEGLAQKSVAPGEPWQVVVMAQAAGGREVLLGARRDASFGPVVAFGAGGVATEVLDDVALKIAPVSATLARSLIGETRIGRILSGLRGLPAADLDAVSRALTALSRLLLDFPVIQEVDLNPVLVFPGKPGLLVLDARVKVSG